MNKLKQIVDILVHPILWIVALFIKSHKRIIPTWLKMSKDQLKKWESATDSWKTYHAINAKRWYINAFLCYFDLNEATTKTDIEIAAIVSKIVKNEEWINYNPWQIKWMVREYLGWNYYLYSTFNYFNYSPKQQELF